MRNLIPVICFCLMLFALTSCGGETTPEPEETGLAQLPASESTPAASETEPEEEPLQVPELDEGAVVEQLGAVLTIDNAAYEYYNFKIETADAYVKTINRAAQKLEGIAQVYSLIVPNSMGICVPEKLQEEVNTSDQRAAIDYMYASMDDSVTTVPVYDALLKYYLEDEYLYFRTDHHWTAQGAYRAYEQFAKAAELEATPLEDYICHKFEGFLGSFYNTTQSELLKRSPDTVYAYEAPSTNNIRITNKEQTDWLYVVIGDVTNASAGNKYTTFIGGDNPYSYIENPDLTDGSAILLVKESYGNAFAPFLIENYQYVYIVDYRYVSQVEDRTLEELCRELNIRDVLFLNNISATRSDSLVEKLDGFVG